MVIAEIEESLVILGEMCVLALAKMHRVIFRDLQKIEHGLGGAPRRGCSDGIGPQIAEGVSRQDRAGGDQCPQEMLVEGQLGFFSAKRLKSLWNQLSNREGRVMASRVSHSGP